MTEDSVAAIEAAPETVVIETPEGTEGQVETPPAEGQPEEKSESAKRREREKAYRARLQTEAAEAKPNRPRRVLRQFWTRQSKKPRRRKPIFPIRLNTPPPKQFGARNSG